MKKIAAILLMLVVLFNLCGYRMMIDVLQQKADTKLETRLDSSDYDESQLIEIKVALNLPYQERYTEFERHYGEIDIDGKSYTYVKSKMNGDTLVLKCIANESKQELTKIKNDLTKANSSSDLDHPGKPSPQKSFAKSFFPDYDDQCMFQLAVSTQQELTPSFSYLSYNIAEGVANIPHQPPRNA